MLQVFFSCNCSTMATKKKENTRSKQGKEKQKSHLPALLLLEGSHDLKPSPCTEGQPVSMPLKKHHFSSPRLSTKDSSQKRKQAHSSSSQSSLAPEEMWSEPLEEEEEEKEVFHGEQQPIKVQ